MALKRRLSQEELQDACGEQLVDDRVVVYTDGTCSNHQDLRFRPAGVGAFWCKDRALNLSLALPSARPLPDQSADGAA